MSGWEPILAGIALAACAGFRAFLPLLGTGVLMRMNHWPDPPLIGWAATDEGLLLLGVATLAEILADKVPVIDNALDSVETLLKPLAALLVVVGLTHHLSPGAAWTLAIVAGAPLAAGLHLTEATVRGASTGLTGGLANPLLSLVEDVFAVILVVLAVLLPIVAFLVALGLVARGLSWWRARKRRVAPSAPRV